MRCVEAWPRWIELFPAEGKIPALEVQFARPSRSMKRRARHEAAGLLTPLEEGEERDMLELADVGDAYSRALITRAILGWRGVGGADGKPLPFTPANVQVFLDQEEFFDAADAKYVQPEVAKDAEKNGLSASPVGTGEAATQEEIIAISPASSADPEAGATDANIGSSNPKPTKAAASGN
jgi:hypothetical protein